MTPRTDARCCEPTEFGPGQEAQLIHGWVEFARKLERENLELAAALRAMLLMGHYPPAIEERAKAALKLITQSE
jgi:predicted phosphohydrolase